VNIENNPVKGVKVSDDGMKARIIVDNLRKNYIHHMTADGVRAKDYYYSLVHPSAYYTLNNIPEGQKLNMEEASIRNSAKEAKNARPGKASAKMIQGKAATEPKAPQRPAQKAQQAPTYEEIKPLLAKNTCLACHAVDKKQVGPAYTEVAERNYSNEKIVELIHNPQPQNWPDYAVAMPPMPQVPKEEALKIAAWINSLNQ
jgi:cytochrome c551/c552